MSLLRQIILYFVMFSVFVNAAHADVIRGSDIGYGNWNGAAYTNVETGVFSHCVVSADYISGDELYFSVTSAGEIGVGISSPNLNLRTGERFPISLYVDRRAPIYGTAEAREGNFAILFIPELDRALNDFKRGQTLVVEGVGLRGEYDLTGTFRALDEVIDCAIRYYGITQDTTVPSASSVNIDQSYLYQIATKTITSFGLTDFSFVDSQTVANIGLGGPAVRWTAPNLGITGTVLAINYVAGEDLKSTDAQDTQFVASSCPDEYASSVRNLSAEGRQVREIRVICMGQNRLAEHFISKFVAGDYVIYTWFEVTDTGVERQGPSTRERASSAALIAASFVLE